MLRRASGKRRTQPEEKELNITPIMNLFMIIVPFLLLTVSFAKIAIIEMNLPQSDGSNSSNEPDKPPEILTIDVTKEGFELGGIGEGIVIKKDENKYNYKKLNKELAKVKDKYPRKEEVIILFEPDLPYETVIGVMDAARETTGKSKRSLFPLVSVGEVEEDIEIEKEKD